MEKKIKKLEISSKFFRVSFQFVDIFDILQQIYFQFSSSTFQAISPGLVETDTIHSEISNEPALSAADVSAACLYAISVKDHVQVT